MLMRAASVERAEGGERATSKWLEAACISRRVPRINAVDRTDLTAFAQ